ncbi:MAG TPA: aminodeoxychorismate synthase component I [Rhodothermales bacterium]|nr:aminodeoxychorismate synthase component I [Rhodothermales bacterium]
MAAISSPLAQGLFQPGTLLFDTARLDDENHVCLLFAGPSRLLTANDLEEVPGVLAEVDEAVAAGAYVAGYLSYEAGYAFEKPAFEAFAEATQPLIWFGVYEAPTVLGKEEVADLLMPFSRQEFEVEEAHLAISRAAYRDKIAAVKAHIREGDVYQINFTDRVHFTFSGSPVSLYATLRQRQQVPYSALLNLGETTLLCLSPELFFRRDKSRIVTRPMKGTVRRGRTVREDADLRTWLAHDAKSRAENLMIVDLLRNDLSRVCEPGSVVVPDLFTTETYETLTQMTSTVAGQLRRSMSYADIFAALFPCGSVTGAPKIRAMQIIRDLETGPRGVYCGALGYIAPDQRAVFNVAIRTVEISGEEGRMGTGSGIVWDSDADAEYDECVLKTQFLTRKTSEMMADFDLFETMRSEDGSIALLDGHVERLRDSAAYFDIPFNEASFRSGVNSVLGTLAASGTWRVRVTLSKEGRFSAWAGVIEDEPESFGRVTFAEEPIDSSNPLFYHKTTNRAVYESAFEQAQAQGFGEVLFVNERGEVTEGSRTNIFIQQGDALLTPPISSGLLNGVYRRHLLATRDDVEEQVVYPEDVQQADAVFLCNAVRGMQPVEDVADTKLQQS